MSGTLSCLVLLGYVRMADQERSPRPSSGSQLGTRPPPGCTARFAVRQTARVAPPYLNIVERLHVFYR